MFDTEDVGVFLGLDVGKTAHHDSPPRGGLGVDVEDRCAEARWSTPQNVSTRCKTQSTRARTRVNQPAGSAVLSRRLADFTV
jgi:hypothetical protein